MMASTQHSSRYRILISIGLLILGVTLLITRWEFRFPTTSVSPRLRSESKGASIEQRLIFAAGIVEGLAAPLEVRFEIPGRIKAVHVREGQTVKKDEVLAELDPQLFELAVNMADAELRTAQLQTQLSDSLQASSADAAMKSSSSGSASPVRPVSVNRSGATNEKQIAVSRVRIAEYALQKEQLQLARTRLQSPIDGTIVESLIHPGELTGPADGSAAFRIVDRTRTRIRAWVEELDAMDVRPGMSAVVIASGSEERRYRGTVVSCSGYVKPKSERHLNPGERVDVRVREIIVELKDGHELLLGLPVEVFVATGRSGRGSGKNDPAESSL